VAPFQIFVRWSRLPTKMATKLKIEKGGMIFFFNLLLWNYWANLNQTLLRWPLGGPLPKLCQAFRAPDKLRICVFYAMKTSKNECIISNYPLLLKMMRICIFLLHCCTLYFRKDCLHVHFYNYVWHKCYSINPGCKWNVYLCLIWHDCVMFINQMS
jgi:hypothetical protein